MSGPPPVLITCIATADSCFNPQCAKERRPHEHEQLAFMVVRADSHEAAAKLFEKHPHFTIFPGESVEVMPVLPIPDV